MSYRGTQPKEWAFKVWKTEPLQVNMQGQEQTGVKRCRAVHDISKDNKDKKVATQEFDVVRKKSFNFHSIRLVIIAKLKTKKQPKTHTCEYKIGTGSDGNLMPIRRYKVLFLHANISQPKQSINKKAVLHTCNISCTPQMGICRVTIINKGITYWCSFFVGLEKWTSLTRDARL